LLEMRDPDKDVRECTGRQGYDFLFRRLIPPSQVPSVPKMFLSRDEVRRNLDRLTNFTRGEVVLADDVWHELTSYPGDDSITDDAFIAALGSYAVYPLLVYPVIDFGSKTWQNLTVKSSVCANFVLVDHESMAVPVDTHEWHEFYAQLVRAGEDPLAKSPEQCSDPMTPRFMATGADLKGKKFVPVLAPGSADDIRVIHLASAADAVGQGEEDLLERTMVRSSRITLVGASRDDDVVHSFNASTGVQMKNAATVFRGSSAENEAVASLGAEQDGDQMFVIPPNAEITAELKDTTTVVIRGAVLFPKSRTQGSTCGLSNARIVLQYDGGQTDTVQTDDAGWFEISVTQRANVKFSADYSNENGVEHDICYASSTLAAATDVNSCEGHKREISVIATEGVFIFFADVTRGTIDLGVYHGVCARRYTGTKFKVTPVNGCHPRALVTHDDIVAWKQVSDESGPEREWPFAAMDYSVSFDEGPSVGGVLDLLAENESKFGNAQCETEPGDMYSYFSSRDALDRLVLMRDGFDNTQRVHYEYHGYLCVEISDVPKIVDDKQTCLKSQSAAGGLLKAHIVGGGANASEFMLDEVRKRDFNLRLKTYEVHKDDNALHQCFNLPNGDSGSTTIIVKESVSDPENNDQSCHVSRGGCRFDVTDGGIWNSSHPNKTNADACDEGEFIFNASEASEHACERFINIGLPNLAFPYRRTIQVDVVRDDTSRSVTASTTRQLVVTGTKARGGGGFSSDVFWATVPLDDMVYTVLHDPPGGLSHSELSSGTELTLTYTLAKTRAASAGGSFDSISTGAAEAKVGAQVASGVGVEVTTDAASSQVTAVPSISELSYHADLPTLSMSVTADDGWDISLTTDRVLRSSQDPMLPGQDGDAIFGGGMELTYTLSDDVDLSRKGEPTDADPVCVNSVPVIVWRPRKLTTYFLVRFDIEALIIPNLKFLMSIAKSGKVQAAADGWSETKTTYVQALHKHIRDWESVLLQAGAKDVSDNIQHFVGDHIKQHIQDEDHFFDAFKDPIDDNKAKEIGAEWTDLHQVDFAMSAFSAASLAEGIAVNAIFNPPGAVLVASAALVGGPTAMQAQADHGSRHRAGVPRDYDFFKLSDRSEFDGGLNIASFTLQDAAGWYDDTDEDETTTRGRAFASLTGANRHDTKKEEAEDNDIVLLTFSGGGTSLDFEFTSDEGVDGDGYESNIELSGGDEIGSHISALLKTDVLGLGLEQSFGFGRSQTNARTISYDRAFAWTKNARMVSRYSLGDENAGDKFVVQVATDTRFGTPVFVTKGGRSSCPGERNTIYRESGIKLAYPERPRVSAESLNPNERVALPIIVQNMSPYREASQFVIRIVDGLASSLRDIGRRAFELADAGLDECVDEIRKKCSASIAAGSLEIQSMLVTLDEVREQSDITCDDVARALHREIIKQSPLEGEFVGDSTFSVNGNTLSFGEFMTIHVAGDALEAQNLVSQFYFELAVDPGSSTRSIPYLGLELASACEMESTLYRQPLSHVLRMDNMTWLQYCPEVRFAEVTLSNYSDLVALSSSTGDGVLRLKVVNPKYDVLWPKVANEIEDPRMNSALKYIRVQYRRVGDGEWTTAHNTSKQKENLLCGDSRTQGCEFKWDVDNEIDQLMSGFKDGEYEVRVKNYCTGVPALAPPLVHEFVGDEKLTLSIDTKKPIGIRRVQMGERTFGIEFDEPIDCASVEGGAQVWRNATTCTEEMSDAAAEAVSAEALASTYDFRCSNNDAGYKWIVVFPEDSTGTYWIRLQGVRDIAGNVADPTHVLAQVRCGVSDRISALGMNNTRASRLSIRYSWFACACGLFAIALLRCRRRQRDDGDGDQYLLQTKTPKTYGATI
jgi:hypothetical protein